MSEQNQTETMDMTPTWSEILPGLLAIIANGETVEARKTAEAELRRMARLAGKYVEAVLSQPGWDATA